MRSLCISIKRLGIRTRSISKVIYLSNNGVDIKFIIDALNKDGIYPENAKEVCDKYAKFCSVKYHEDWVKATPKTIAEFIKWLMLRFPWDDGIESLYD